MCATLREEQLIESSLSDERICAFASLISRNYYQHDLKKLFFKNKTNQLTNK